MPRRTGPIPPSRIQPIEEIRNGRTDEELLNYIIEKGVIDVEEQAITFCCFGEKRQLIIVYSDPHTIWHASHRGYPVTESTFYPTRKVAWRGLKKEKAIMYYNILTS